MQAQDLTSTAADIDVGINDLGPLAWVLDELRKSLDGAAKALKRFVREAEAAKGSDLATLDASQLRIARQQLHQAVGALEMVGLAGPALVLRAMEAAVQRFVEKPEQCSQDAATKIEHASFALTEYLEGVLADKPVSPVSLFPQYRQVQELVKADRIHPADLWPMDWRWLEPELNAKPEPRNYDTASRTTFDQSVLQIMKGQAPLAAAGLKDLSLGFSARQADRQPRIFWKIAAAYFEALEHSLLPSDIYVRRASSRVLLQYASLSKGDTGISDRLAQDLLFFCAQASASATPTPVLAAVRTAYGLARFKAVDYEAVLFGRFDPALLAQARKRIVSAKETWSALSAGDANKFKAVVDQFSLVTDSLVKLHPPSEPLAQALTRAIDATARSGQPPPIELAMEVATSVLYLEAAFDDLDPSDLQLAARTKHLAERLESVKNGGVAQPLESWMEDLYRRVSDKQTMGSVVGELRVSLGELEKSLDIFFRNPKDKVVLTSVPGQLAQMRGVLSVLGLDQASHAVMRMRDTVEQMLETEIDEERARAAGTFDQLGNNLGALSFLIDMLNYQPALAKKLFVYDDVKGELKPLMGRVEKAPQAAAAHEAPGQTITQEVTSLVQDAGLGASDDALGVKLTSLATHAALAGQPVLAQAAHDASVAVSGHDTQATANALNTLATAVAPAAASPASQVVEVDFEEDDLRDIFLEEAREVAGNGLEAVRLLGTDPGDINQLTVLRRVFHTLKGSSRMVGLNEFGEAAWSMEQLFNGWLADQKPASHDLLSLSGDSLAGFSRWIEDIAANSDSAWVASAFRTSAEAMRTEGKLSPLVLPQAAALAAPLPMAELEPAAAPVAPEQAVFDQTVAFAVPVNVPEADQPVSASTDSDLDFDFFATSDAPAAEAPAPATPVAAEPDMLTIEGIDFDSLSAISGVQEAPTAAVDAASAELLEMQALQKQLEEFEAQSLADSAEAAASPSAFADVADMSAADFEAEFLTPAAAAPASVAAPALIEPVADFELPELDIEEPALALELDAVSSEELDVADNTAAADDEQIKVIGDLRIGIPLYNVYLNEADEWSRRLLAELSEWAMERSLPVSDTAVSFAHSLAGSSATVGFNSLSEMARALEDALQLSQAHYSDAAAAQYADVFVNAAEDIRRLLHQFAAGFLKDSDPVLLSQLRALEFPDAEAEAEPVSEPADLDLDFDMASLSVPAPAPAPADTPKAERAEPVAELTLKPPVAIDLPAAPAVVPVVPVMVAVAAVASLSALPVMAAHHATAATVASVAPQLGDDGDDDIDAVDAIDAELFPIFDEEATELMPELGGALRQWSARPDNLGARNEVLRALHTLKGSARLAGALRLGEVAHKIESEIEFLGTDAAATQDFEPLLNRFDTMQHMLDVLRKADAVHETPSPAAAPATPVAVSAVSAPVAAAHTDALPDIAPIEPKAEPGAEPTVARTAVGKAMIPAPQTMAMQPLRQAATASIRVRSQLLDRMVNQAGEVMITRSRLEVELNQLRGSLGDMSDNLNRLRQHLRDIELQAETQMQSRLAQAKELQAGFDPLEFDRFTRVQELTRMMAESVNDVATVQRTLQRTVEATEDDLVAQARQTRELQRDLLKTRMVEFEGISDRLYRVVRLASKETGKQVKLDLLGATIEMDRGMLDRMTPAFEHLLRNCVAHGIESPSVRSAAGKDAAGLITVELRQEGNDVSVEFRDDGAGLDLKRIREKAISSGLISADQQLDDQEAANLIFMPGFTTAAQVTELSGRGIGMDVVRSEVNGVGGRIETATTFGQGTQFKLVLPLTTAVTQVVMIRSGRLAVGVPANVVETVRRTNAKDLQQAYNTGTLDVGGEAVPFFWSGALLQASAQSAEVQTKNSSVVVFRSAAQRVALHVDEVLGNQEVVVKNLGPQLSRLPGLAGMSVLASGAVVLIYNPVALASVYGIQARALSGDSAEPHMLEAAGGDAAPVLVAATPQIPLVMVVDDSITVRRVTQRLLQREGYRVVLAADGLQALERLQEERPAVVLSDIEMPRMDGFDLARNIRGDVRLKDLPIVMITSRIAEKHREYAKELGVDHYLGKPYPEDELMSLVRHYCSVEATA
jgi:chemosensory pili system protein ChpA (sensor histidine kinase/response regulator)